MVQFAKALIAGIAVGLTGLLATPAKADADFDFYVLALSWSPSYCATDDDPSVEECSVDRGFVVHGLWPQYERGYPEYCSSSQPRWLEQDVIDDNRDIFPSKDLAIHQWRKHGMCAGLDQGSRFRPIVLTSLTTTAGLFPMLFETSSQALFLVPMAIALSFGTVASTFVVLLLIPALHAIWADLCRLLGIRPPGAAAAASVTEPGRRADTPSGESD